MHKVLNIELNDDNFLYPFYIYAICQNEMGIFVLNSHLFLLFRYVNVLDHENGQVEKLGMDNFIYIYVPAKLAQMHIVFPIFLMHLHFAPKFLLLTAAFNDCIS